MKKSLIASAVAAATISSSAFAMDPATDLAEMLKSMPTIYGNIQLAHFNSTYNDNIAGTVAGDGVDGDDTTHELEDNGSTIGFKHESAVNDDITAFFKAEFHFDADEGGYNQNGGTTGGLGEKLDEAYIGVKGSFGAVQAGTDDTVYEWVDQIDIVERTGISGDIAGAPEGDNLQYTSPKIADGLTLGVTYPTDSDSTFGGALAAKYSMDNLNVAFAYAIGRKEAGVEEGDTLGLSGSFSMDDITLIAQYEMRGESKSGGTADKDDVNFWGLEGIYKMGQNSLALAYASKTVDMAVGDKETSSIAFQALHNVSDNMYVYLEYLTETTETSTAGAKDVDNDELALGATYAF